MEEIISLEEKKLQGAVERGKEVRIIFKNGYQMNAVITDFDCNVLVCRVKGEEQMVYITAVSTIVFGY